MGLLCCLVNWMYTLDDKRCVSTQKRSTLLLRKRFLFCFTVFVSWCKVFSFANPPFPFVYYRAIYFTSASNIGIWQTWNVVEYPQHTKQYQLLDGFFHIFKLFWRQRHPYSHYPICEQPILHIWTVNRPSTAEAMLKADKTCIICYLFGEHVESGLLGRAKEN